MDFDILDLGLIDYGQAFSLQQKLREDIRDNKKRSALLLCEHYPVITLGRSYRQENILKPQDEIKSLGVDIFCTDRGGNVTLHSPGQLVIYPVFDLCLFGRDINKFLRGLEEVAISLLADFGLLAKRKEGCAGVWIGDKKIASMGIAIRHWISTHGLSLNVNCDLSLFSLIRPCGQDIIMTSLARERRGNCCLSIPEIKRIIIDKFSKVFSRREEVTA